MNVVDIAIGHLETAIRAERSTIPGVDRVHLTFGTITEVTISVTDAQATALRDAINALPPADGVVTR